jgi:hypothetical protein
MGQRVKIKVRPNQTVRFPGLCVNCVQPATERMELEKRIGRRSRMVEVPLCADCASALRRQSGEEERRQRMGWLASGLVFLFTLAIVLLLTPAELQFMVRLFIALSLSLLTAVAIFLFFRRASLKVALPHKRAIYNSAHIANFSWRATTFEFANETFAERFRSLNEPLLMEI